MSIRNYQNCIVYDNTCTKIGEVIQLWKQMSDRERRTGDAQLPAFIKNEFEYLSDIRVTNNDVQFKSRYSPNEEVLLLIAQRFSIGYIHQYYHAESLSFGINLYVDNTLHEYEMEESDYLLYEEQPDGDILFEGKLHKQKQEVFQIIVNRKIIALNRNKPLI